MNDDELTLTIKMNELSFAAEQHMNDIQTLNSYLIEVKSAINNDSKRDMSREDITTSLMMFHTVASLSGYKSDKTVSVEAYASMSIEALDGERKDFSERVEKYIKNIFTSLTHIFKELDGVLSLLKGIKYNRLLNLIEDIDANNVIPKKEKIINEKLNKDLAFHFVTGNDNLHVDGLIHTISISTDLLLKDKLFDSMVEFAYDNLIVSSDNEQAIPRHQASVDYLDSIKLKSVREWLNKDTKFGIFNRYIGDKFAVLSVYQDDDGADARYDYYTVPASQYLGKVLTPLSVQDCKKLLHAGVELAKKAPQLAAVGKENAFDTFFKDLRSGLMTAIFQGVFGIFAIKRKYRQLTMGGVYASGVYSVLIGLKKSHIDMLDTIVTIVSESITKKSE